MELNIKHKTKDGFMNSKTFSQRFNRELSLIGFPDDLTEKTKAVAKVFGITRHLANALLFGYSLPSIEQLNKMAEILEVCPLWLSGETERRKAYSKEALVE
jgi:transcriptional regulator with XRE-family HTH domain